ncbi:MAG: hypothetical protein KatS3mg059_0618 [Thermomicrobiales bacterium]|nr:MAG: hypothetical protein KatS3mg059_0618 [Thermomicrobiales bacterium]
MQPPCIRAGCPMFRERGKGARVMATPAGRDAVQLALAMAG